MIWAHASAWSAPPAAELLLRCRQEDEQWWTCGDVVLKGGARFAEGPLRARLTVADGVVVELFDQPGDEVGAQWTAADGQVHHLLARGPRATTERAVLEWVTRGGPGGGPVTLDGVVVELPLGCVLADDRGGTWVSCSDGSRLGVGAAGFDGTQPVASVACAIRGAPASCAVFARASGVYVRGGADVCAPSAGLALEACVGLVEVEAAALRALVAEPATAACRLAPVEPPTWDCGGARVVVVPSAMLPTTPAEMPAQPTRLGWAMASDGRYRMCNGPDLWCAPVLTAWAQHPPGARSVVVGGRARPIPVGCDAAGSVATCEDGTRADLATGQCAGPSCRRLAGGR